MAWKADIDEWAKWVKVRLAKPQSIPSPRYWLQEVPWLEDFRNLSGEDGPPDDLHEAIEDGIRGANELEIRFVGLDLYHRLAHQDSWPLTDELIDDAREQAGEEYQWLVEAIPVDDVPLDRRRIDWELRLCCPLRLWQRADSLLDRLEGLRLDGREVNSIRAQHLFLRRYAVLEGDTASIAFIEDTSWGADLVDAESIERGILATRALALDEPLAEPPVPSAEEVLGSVELGIWSECRWLKPLLECRPFFELGLY